jgi:hypothetical protein
MARLIVEAVTNENTGSDSVGRLNLFVSVSRADDGTPVTGLTKDNFRISSSIGIVIDPAVSSTVSEAKWEPGDSELSGCYRISILRGGGDNWSKGELYAFGIQVRVNEGGSPVHFGQTAVSVTSLGT